MSYCINCGKELPDGARFCTFCGASQTTVPIQDSASEQQTVMEKTVTPEQENELNIEAQSISASEEKIFHTVPPVATVDGKMRPHFLWGIGTFVVAIVAFFLPGWAALIISAASFVLAIVLLAKRGRLYGFAIAALVISCMGLIVSAYKVVFNVGVKKITEMTTETSQDIDADKEHPTFIVGTYAGEDGSGLTLFPDGATQYYFYTDPKMYNDGTWEYANEEILWHFKGGSVLSECDVTAEVKGEDASELYFQSDSLVWKDEHYKKVSDKAENYSAKEYQSMISEAYPDVLASEEEDSGYAKVEYIGITFQMPSEFASGKVDNNGIDYYMNNGGTAALLFCGVNDIGLPHNATQNDIEKACGVILDRMLEDMPQGLSLKGENEYDVDGMICRERDYAVEESGKDGMLRLVLMLNEKTDGVLITGVLVDDNETGKENLDVFDTMVKTAKRTNGAGTDTTTRNSGSSDSANSNGVDPDLKAYLDSYEAFMDEYVDFMKNYLDDPTNVVSMLDEYSDIMKRMEEFEKQNDAYESSDMSTADMEYFLDVTTRCTKKMLEIYTD